MSLFKHNCKTDGHNFQPRYDEKPRDCNFKAERLGSDKIRDILTYKVYVHDVCQYCGKITK